MSYSNFRRSILDRSDINNPVRAEAAIEGVDGIRIHVSMAEKDFERALGFGHEDGVCLIFEIHSTCIDSLVKRLYPLKILGDQELICYLFSHRGGFIQSSMVAVVSIIFPSWKT